MVFVADPASGTRSRSRWPDHAGRSRTDVRRREEGRTVSTRLGVQPGGLVGSGRGFLGGFALDD